MESGIIPSAERKRKIPAIRKNEPKKRYAGCLFNFAANTEQKEPDKTRINEIKIDIREEPSMGLKRKVVPRIIKERPIIKTSFAASFKSSLDFIFIYMNIPKAAYLANGYPA